MFPAYRIVITNGFFYLFLIIVLTISPALAQVPAYQNVAFKTGEQLDYVIHYGIINAGTARLQVADKLKTFDNKKHYYYYARGLSNSGWDFFFKVRDYYYSYVDTSTLLPVFALREVLEGDFSNKEQFLFKRKENILISKNELHQVPADIMDILSAIFYARCFDYNKIPFNTEIPFITFFENEIFPISIIYEGKTKIKTRFGYMQCLVIKPKLIEGRVFKGQKDMTLYVSDDMNHIPLKVKTAIFIGYIEADLISFNNTKYPLIFSRE
jgi:hypothetical protein